MLQELFVEVHGFVEVFLLMHARQVLKGVGEVHLRAGPQHRMRIGLIYAQGSTQRRDGDPDAQTVPLR